MSNQPNQITTYDELRRGLSYGEEVTLLCALKGRWTRAPRDPSSRLALVLDETTERLATRDHEDFCRQIERDVWREPLRTPVHPQWLALWRNELPGRLRAELRDYPRRVSHSWLEATTPVASARLRRVENELGCLLTKPREVVEGSIHEASLFAVALALESLSTRRGASYRAAFADIVDLDAVTVLDRWRQNSALVETARHGLARASAGANEPAHLLGRFQSFMLAAALEERHIYEARALAYACSPRAGKRLLRYHRAIIGITDPNATLGVRELLLAAMDKPPPSGEPS